VSFTARSGSRHDAATTWTWTRRLRAGLCCAADDPAGVSAAMGLAAAGSVAAGFRWPSQLAADPSQADSSPQQPLRASSRRIWGHGGSDRPGSASAASVRACPAHGGRLPGGSPW
jgi:hypothetical protein